VVTQFGNTLQIYDVANPATPVSVGSVATAAEPSTVFVQGRYAYVTSSLSTTTLQIYDVSSPVAPVSVGTATTGAANSVYVQGRYAYVIATGGTLKIFDVANPASPTQSGSVSIGTGCPTASQSDIFVQGRYAYTIDCNTATLKFVDVSNPASPTVVGSVATGTRPRSVFVQGRYVYVTNELSNTLQVFDAGGAYLQQLEAGGIETGTLATRSNLQVGNDLDVRGGLEVARGIKATGPVAIYSGGSGSTLLSVGNSTFQVNSSGNLTKINNISYSWPASQGGASTILTNDGSGNLSWVAAGGGGTIGGSGTTNYLAKFTASNAIDNSVIYDDGTNIGIGTSSLSSKLTVSGQITGGFGAMTTSGTLDWNDASNARSGNGYSLLMGNATNGPGPAHYYHSFGFEYSSKTGAGNMTQLAIPYNMNYTDGGSNLFIRSRYGGTWGGWRKVLSEDANGRVGIGVLNPTYDLQVAGAIRFEVPAGTHQGPICHNNGELGWCSFNSALTSHVCRSGTTVLGYCSADYSEFMPTVSRQGYLISKGDIVSVANTGNSVFDTTAMFATEKASLPYDNKIIGVVSPSNSSDGKKVSDDYRPTSLIGRVPVNVSTINGEIKAGDAITSSSLAGIGMRATKSGSIVGKALEDFTYDLGKCKDIKRLEEIVWPDIIWEENTAQAIEMTKDWRDTCFKLPDETVVGRTLLFINVSWYEPANEKDEILERLDQQQKEIENLKLQIEGLKK